jgi:ABC-type glycerol-3-phosphate transport system substrate-binding protein
MRIALLLALVLLLAAAGCGSNGDSGGDESPSGKPTTTQKDEGYNYP